MSIARKLSPILAAIALLSAHTARADLINYAFTAEYYRVRIIGPFGDTVTLPAISPQAPVSLQQGTAAGSFSIDTAAPLVSNVNGDAVYLDALTLSVATSTGLVASERNDLVLHVPTVFSQADSHFSFTNGPVPVPGWQIVQPRLSWANGGESGPLISSTDLNALPIFTTADFIDFHTTPIGASGAVGGDIAIVIQDQDGLEASLIYRIDTLTYLGRVPAKVPEPASLVLLASGMVGFGWMARRKR